MTITYPVARIYAPESAGTENVWNVAVAPGTYHWILLAARLQSVTDDIGGVGDDWYRILAWS